MWGYVGRRLLLAIPTLLGASIIVFAMVHLAPGDPISAILPVDASKEQIEDTKRAYGFDKPLPVQYLKWLGRVVQGDLGKSIATRRAVILDVRVLRRRARRVSPAHGLTHDRARTDPARGHRAGDAFGGARHPQPGVRPR